MIKLTVILMIFRRNQMKTILLARHGQASLGEDNYDKLSELGIEQASILGQFYADNKRQVDKIFTGSMVRQMNTAKHFCKPYLLGSGRSVPAQTFSQLNEFDHEEVLFTFLGCKDKVEFKAKFAEENNASKTALLQMFQDAMIRWVAGEHDDEYQETWSQFSERATEGLNKVIAETEDDSVSLVFTSGGIISSTICRLLENKNNPHTNVVTWIDQLVNTGVTTILIDDNNTHKNLSRIKQSDCQLLTVNDCEHLLLSGKEFLSWY